MARTPHAELKARGFSNAQFIALRWKVENINTDVIEYEKFSISEIDDLKLLMHTIYQKYTLDA